MNTGRFLGRRYIKDISFTEKHIKIIIFLRFLPFSRIFSEEILKF